MDQHQDHQPTHMHNIIPKLYIGDYIASQSIETLQRSNIRNIVAAMKQSYPTHPNFDLLRVPIDDTDKTNICEWFDIVGDWIQSHLDREDGYGVLVHCQAGVSRSTTLVAAYLMKAKRLTAEEAVFYIASRRPQVQPTEFFIHQLEMYERCNCEWDPVKYQEQRRFVMGFVADEMRDGAGAQKLVLAYYPSPAPSPRDRQISDPFTTFAMTPLNTQALHTKLTSPSPDPTDPSSTQPTQRQRLTKRGGGSDRESFRPAKERLKTPEVEKLGQGKVTIRGRRIRCRMCRRELAARDHILTHTPGEGQSAFAPQKRDMTKFREEAMAKLRVHPPVSEPPDDLDRFDQEPIEPPLLVPNPKPPTTPSPEVIRGLGSLRVSLPLSHHPSSNSSEADDLPNSSAQPSGLPRHASPGFIAAVSNSAMISPPLITSQQCSSYFVEPLSWMANVLERGELVGKLVCPNQRCGSKLGNFDWAGCQCSCGAWITPGFQISRSKVDEV